MTITDIIGVTVLMSFFYAFFGVLWANAALYEVDDRQRALRIAWAAPVWPLGLLGLLVWWIGWRALPGLAEAWREAWGKPEPIHIHHLVPTTAVDRFYSAGPELFLRAGVNLGDLTATEPDTIPDEPPPAGQWEQPPSPNQAKPAAIPLQKPHLTHVPR